MSLKDKEIQMAELEMQLAKLDDEDVHQKDVLKAQLTALREDAYRELSAWDVVYLARHPKRPKASDVITAMFPDFIELHGDRAFGDDGACQGGLASFHGIPVTVLAQSKGKTLEENMKRNFGMLQPEGYRKAIRLAKEAERFHRPVITIVDTSGAYPGKGAEERGQAEAIAQCLQVFSTLDTPVIAVVLSEGGSGGALAFSVADHIFMLENAIYSILSPEGFASILWKDGSKASEAAQVMGLRACDLLEKGIIDDIIKEPQGGAHVCFAYVIEQLDEKLWNVMQQLIKTKGKTRLHARYEKFRRMGAPYEL